MIKSRNNATLQFALKNNSFCFFVGVYGLILSYLRFLVKSNRILFKKIKKVVYSRRIDFYIMDKIKSQPNTALETDPYSLSYSHSFFLKEQILKGRLLAVVIRPTIIIKKGIDQKMKGLLVRNSIDHMKNNPHCQIAIFLKGFSNFFSLKSAK